ncbi:MAG: tripartite tricarboxylate transporter substrate binding protein [Clostridiales bacterium]|nr:tripartite tricarboxylate transporter substrate binding protein [Clostridiales bacterium]
MKKLAALLLAAAMVLSLAACGTSNKNAGEESPAPSASPAAGTAESTWNVTRPEGLPADFPSKEITYIYPFGVGSMQDIYFRILAEKIKEKEGWKYGFVVKQQEGASGDIGWTNFIKSKPDGYTIGFAPTAQQITAIAYGKNYTADNMAYIFNMMSDPGAVGVSSKSQYATLQDLMNAAKENPGKITIGVTSVTGSEGLAVLQLEEASGAKFKVVPYDGETEVLTAVAGGHCDAYCLNVGDLATFLSEGSIKILAVGSEERSELVPDVPTYKECGYDVIQVNSRAIAAPAGTDEAIIKYLSDCFVAAANDPDVKAQCADMTIPYDTKDYKETTEMFMGYFKTYKDLWEKEPWA